MVEGYQNYLLMPLQFVLPCIYRISASHERVFEGVPDSHKCGRRILVLAAARKSILDLL